MDNLYRGDRIVDNLHVRLFTAQWLKIGVEWDTQNVQSSYWRLYRNREDGAALEIETGRYPLQAGSIYLVPAGVRFSCFNTRPVMHFYIHFDVAGLSRLALQALFYGPIHVPNTPYLHERIQTAVEILAAGKPIDLALQCDLKAVVYQAIGAYLRHLPAEQMEHYWRLASASEPVMPALGYIEANLGASLSNALLSELCCLSENYFIERFRECVGQSPARYIIERRITAAAQRLLFTDDPIERIAEQTGFGSRAYFTRVFTRLLGTPPAAYRKSSRV